MKDIHDVIKHAKFDDDRLRGSGVVAGQISAFPIDFAGRPYNTLTLPCERVIYCISAYTVLKQSTVLHFVSERWLQVSCFVCLWVYPVLSLWRVMVLFARKVKSCTVISWRRG